MKPRGNIPDDKRNDPARAHSNLTMRAKDIMTVDIISVEPKTSVHTIAQLLSANRIGGMPVIDSGLLVGIVSEGDLMHRQELRTEIETADTRAKSHGMHASDVMTREIFTVSEETPLADVVRVLHANRIRRVPVVRGARLVGMISRHDIMRALAARPEGSHGPTSRDDDMIRYQVIETLLSIRGTSPWATKVTVINGVVELNGSVEDELIRDPSRIAVEVIPGVVEVRDHRTILQPY